MDRTSSTGTAHGETAPVLEVSDAIAIINQTLEYAYQTLVIDGEVAGFRVNQNRYVFFDIKDASGTLSCFMTVYQLRTALEDGMKVRIVATPKLTPWGKFSLTVRSCAPVGKGSLKRSFELLKAKLESEGVFAPERKRTLPALPSHIAVISSVQAAGYADFIRILGDRWGGLRVSVAHTLVQGSEAPAQIVRAIEYFNQLPRLPEVIVIIRGGGSADDLAAFNDEPLTRAIAGSRIPVMTGIGHETDMSLVDLAADVRAATPSNAAQLLVPDKREILARVAYAEQRMRERLKTRLSTLSDTVTIMQKELYRRMKELAERTRRQLEHTAAVFAQLDPYRALNRGYAIVRTGAGIVRSGTTVKRGDELSVEVRDAIIKAGVTHVEYKK